MVKLLLSFGIFVIVIIVLTGLYFQQNPQTSNQVIKPTSAFQQSNTETTNQPLATIIAQDLKVPWALDFLLDGSILFTERDGRIRIVDTDGVLDPNPIATLPNVKQIGEGGLLGIAIDPEFSKNSNVYLYYTYDGTGDDTLNRVVVMKYSNRRLTDEKVIVDAIPGASNHNGGRIKFGPDGYLYIATGDAQEPSLAQNKNSLAGKILRVTTEGKAAPGNPFGNRVYSYGHRNVQGLAWDEQENLWATEHGRSGVQSGLDELNLIKPGNNYGWDTIQGNETKNGMVTPVRNSGNTTWAPSGAAVLGNNLYFAGLRGKSLYTVPIQNNTLGEVTKSVNLGDDFGRLREVVAGPDGMLYITTSNRDGRGVTRSGDDKIIKVNPSKL